MFHSVNFRSTKAWLVFWIWKKWRLWKSRANLMSSAKQNYLHEPICWNGRNYINEPISWNGYLPMIKIILYMAISIAGATANNLCFLLALKKLFHVLLCFIHNNNNLFCFLSRVKRSLVKAFLGCIMQSCQYNSNKQSRNIWNVPIILQPHETN